MKDITYIFIKEEKDIKEDINYIVYNPTSFIFDLSKIKTKYVAFIKNYDNLDKSYFEVTSRQTDREFDSCFINYTIEIDNQTKATELMDDYELRVKPYAGKYIWSFIFKKEKLLTLYDGNNYTNERIDELFTNCIGIRKPLYHHIPGKKIVKNFMYVDEKNEERRTNIFYLGTYCNGRFNGYISWLLNIGKCFGNKYKMTILYDKITDVTKKRFERYFEVIERKEDTNFICDRLFVTYSTYYYPKNVIHMEENYLFIHGNMCDYPRSRKYKYDNYTKYIAVSKACAKAAEGYFPTDHIEYVLNPIKIIPEEVYPHLKLVSASRNDPIKKLDRIHKMSQIMDEMNIPYTWNVFIDKKPYKNEVYGGVVYRKSVLNTIPYINDADYYVQLSDSEAYCYSVAEALYMNTKVVVTPIECYKELKIDDSQGFVIPFEFFEDGNRRKLAEIVVKMYKEVDKKIQNKLDESMFQGYNDLLKK